MPSNQICKNFINEIAQIIQKVAKERGYAICSTVIAQACIESAYGTSSLGYKYHNYFGMKCGSSYKGKSVNMRTMEEYTKETINNTLNKYNVHGDGYFLLSSANRWTKNNFRALVAIDNLIMSNRVNSNKEVVVLGCDKQHEKFFLKQIKSKNNFIFLDYVPAEELDDFYKNAQIFIYPSMLEGFGYPPIEAMRHGTQCICSSSTSIPEVCGDAALYFNPYDIESIEITILEALDPQCIAIMKKRINTHFQEITTRQVEDLQKLTCKIEQILFYNTHLQT